MHKNNRKTRIHHNNRAPLPEWRPDITGQVRRNSTYHGFVGGVARKPC